MIKEIKINNFKSVADLTLPLGRFNVLIGANGSGKSNILEAIAFGGAASADKLDNEFLGARGIRATSAKLMKSAFSKENLLKPILLNFKNGTKEIPFTIEEIDKPILKWVTSEKETLTTNFDLLISSLFNPQLGNAQIANLLDENNKDKFSSLSLFVQKLVGNERNPFEKIDSSSIFGSLISKLYFENNYDFDLANFICYSPELSSLRKFEEDSQIRPLGVKGEGMFSILQIFYENYGEETINKIRKYLHIIDWFDDFEAIFDKVSGRKSLVVKDRHLPDVILNQTNVNEGFLFLLFYISLMISKETPAFFAIDNIEASFHPLLCEELIKSLVVLAKAHNKQVILTTHNPFVLDGLDLNDPEQKLFVVRRNGDGETIADEIKPVKNSKLSEAWLRGRIGGNPETI